MAEDEKQSWWRISEENFVEMAEYLVTKGLKYSQQYYDDFNSLEKVLDEMNEEPGKYETIIPVILYQLNRKEEAIEVINKRKSAYNKIFTESDNEEEIEFYKALYEKYLTFVDNFKNGYLDK
ncbi:hypothetical protein [Haloplasma contractile]|uniref:Uncharacterized protein n=1 Tax=Haloplasma contractile SSD-17B TaxID=1033810 RepID=U2E831_9MOLU|nr:hypothetical protein [Haloplasma contractile]ERJ11026.1 hypothetical protein HLPCO_002917 [Haloplasma contractile SSD-17B]